MSLFLRPEHYGGRSDKCAGCEGPIVAGLQAWFPGCARPIHRVCAGQKRTGCRRADSSSILTKLEVGRRAEAAAYLARHGAAGGA
jgi:hypothetical protein